MSFTVRDRYRVVEAVATTADATLYAAEDLEDGRPVTLQVLRGEAATDAEFVTAVREQVHRLTRGGLEHPALPGIHASGTTETGEVFIVLEPVDGRSLRRVLDAQGPLGAEAGLRLAIRVGEALETLHRGGVVHGELRPECVVLSDEESAGVKLLGVELASAHHTALGRRLRDDVVGPYLAPEQRDRNETTEAADIHALGLLVREAITGQRPRGAPAGPGPVGSLSPSVARIVAKALERGPGRRYANVSLMVNDLWTAEAEPEASATAPVGLAAVERRAAAGRRARSDAGMVTAVVGGVLLLVVTGWVVTSDRFVGTVRLEPAEAPVAASPPAPPTAAATPETMAAPPAPPAIEEAVVPPALPPVEHAAAVPPLTVPPPAVQPAAVPPPAAAPAVAPTAAPRAASAPARRAPVARAAPPPARNAGQAAAGDGSDGAAIIDWLLKDGRRGQ